MTRATGRTVRSAGGVVVRNLAGVPHVLLIKDPYDKWGLPKGHAEGQEALHETALREVAEETGLSDLELGPELATIDWKLEHADVPVHKFATFFLMFSERGDPVPERGEGITEVAWVPLEAARERISYPNAVVVLRCARSVLLDAGASTPHTDPLQGRAAPGSSPE
jgi:8-oxo-dGTP pyrophosphatase MutT (NUDIX family)